MLTIRKIKVLSCLGYICLPAATSLQMMPLNLVSCETLKLMNSMKLPNFGWFAGSPTLGWYLNHP